MRAVGQLLQHSTCKPCAYRLGLPPNPAPHCLALLRCLACAVMESEEDEATRWARSMLSSRSAVESNPARVEAVMQVRGRPSSWSC